MIVVLTPTYRSNSTSRALYITAYLLFPQLADYLVHARFSASLRINALTGSNKPGNNNAPTQICLRYH